MNPNHKDHKDWNSYTFFESAAVGIPCIIGFTWNPGSKGSRENGLQMEPDEPAGIGDVVLMDRAGYHAAWLEKKVETLKEWENIYDYINAYLEEERAASFDEDDYWADRCW